MSLLSQLKAASSLETSANIAEAMGDAIPDDVLNADVILAAVAVLVSVCEAPGREAYAPTIAARLMAEIAAATADAYGITGAASEVTH